MDTPATTPVFPLDWARSPGPSQTAIASRADRRHRLAAVSPVVLPGAVPLRVDACDVVYSDSGIGGLAGFGEPAQGPGPEAPDPGDREGAGAELATAAETFVGMSLAEVERLVIEATIRACGGSLPKAARVLDVSPSTLYRKRARWIGSSR